MPIDLEYCRKRITSECLHNIAELLCSSETEKTSMLRLIREDPSVRDRILDSSQLVQALMERENDDRISPYLYLYVGIRFCLRKRGVQSRDIADYASWVCCHFLFSRDLTPSSELMCPKRHIDNVSSHIELYHLRNDVLQESQLRLHLGNYLLFLTGLLNRVISHHELCGGYPIETCESIGAVSFRRVAGCTDDPEFFSALAEEFPNIRLGLADFAKAGFV